MPKKLLIVLATPLVLVIMAALLVPVFLDEDTLLAMASETLEEQTGAKLVVDGGVELSVFPEIAVQLTDAGLTLPGEQETSIKLRSLGIGLQLMPLFSGNAEIDNLSVDGLRMTLQSPPEQPPLDTSNLSDQQLDAFYAKRREALDKAGKAAGNEAVAALPLALNVARLSVSNSVLELVSADKSEITQIEIVQLKATGLNLDGKAIPLSVSLNIDSGKGSTPLTVSVEGGVSVDAASRLLSIDKLAVDVSGALADPVSATISGEVNLSRQTADVKLELALAEGDIRGDGQLRYASFESPQIDANLHFNKFDPALLALAGPGAASSSEKPKAEEEGAGGDQTLPLTAIRAIDTKASLAIDEVTIAGHTIHKAKMKLRAVDGLAKLFPFTGTLHGGQIKMNSTFNAQHNPAKVFSKGEVAGLVIPQALEAMGSDPIMTGKVDLNWKLNSKGDTTNQLVQGMNGPINLLTSKVVLKSVGVEKMLCEAVALTNGESMTRELASNTHFKNLSLNMKMSQGKLHIKPLRAELPHVKLNGQGSLDIMAQNFAMTLTAKLSPELATVDPACRVNKRITGIGWPVNCKGQLSGSPADWCAVDSEKIIQDLATKEVEHQIEKQGSKLLDKLFN